jgi:hypothetical protein
MTEYPPLDPGGRPHIWAVFDFGKPPEVDLGDLGSSMGSIKTQQLELSEGLGVVLFDEYDENELMLVDAVVDQFNPQGGYGGSWIVRLDWSTFRRMPKPGGR